MDVAKEFRKYLGYYGCKRYFNLLETNYFRNYPLTVDNTKCDLHICGPDVASLKGKMVRKQPNKIDNVVMVDIPDTFK